MNEEDEAFNELDQKLNQPKPMNPHLFIATPMYGGQCFGFFTQALLITQNVLPAAGVKSSFSFVFNESLIQRARNLLAHNFLKTDATHLMFIDADIKFNPNDIIPMIQADKDIICGMYPKKEINWQTVRNAVEKGIPNSELHAHTGVFVVNLVDYQEQTRVRMDTPVEIWNGGTGFMLIKREVLEDMAKDLPAYAGNTYALDDPRNGETITEFFATMIEPETNLLLSEDYYFCRRARELGFKV